MTLKQKKIKDIIQNLLNACRQGECDLEELELDDDTVSELRSACRRCNGYGSIDVHPDQSPDGTQDCPDCNVKGIV